MFHDKTIFRVSISVSLLLVLAFVVTGFLNTIYRREKLTLGEKHYSAGRQMERRGDGSGAVEEYRKALLYSPDKPEYRLSFAAALISAGRLDEAESHIDQLLQEDPTNGLLNLMRGQIAMKRNQPAKAIDFYERAVYEFWPPSRLDDRRQARWELISLLDGVGRREQAVGELMTMYSNAPQDLALRLRIGFELLRRSATSEATKVFRDLTAAEPKNGPAHRGLGEALLNSGEFLSARHEFERAIKLDTGDKASAEALVRTNTIIDINPDMAGLTTAERYRRSQNLLRRVTNDLSQCQEAEANDRMLAAKAMMGGKPSRDPDEALRLQNTAAQLWNSRSQICGNTPVRDASLVTVLERMANE